MSVTEIDTAIIGGGILGLLTARELAIQKSNQDIALFEQEHYLGEHTTGRNSGVLHAGLYYEYGSLKHLHCLRGNQLWEKLAKDLNIPFLRSGKFVVADRGQETELDKLEAKARQNTVAIRRASKVEKKKLSEGLKISEALFSPSSGILDVSEAISKLESDLYKRNVPVLKAQKVTKLEKNLGGFRFWVGEDEIRCRQFINCAGLFAVDVRKALGLKDFESYYVKGHYLKTTQRFDFKQLIYPVPPRDLKGLGVHITFDFQGDYKFGPNTLDVETIDYSLPDGLVDSMYPAIQQVFKNVNRELLYADYAGIRPKLKREGQVFSDFWLGTPRQHAIDGYFEFLGIESPGLTAAPSLVLDLIKEL